MAAASALLAAGASADGGRRPQVAHLQRHNQHATAGGGEWAPPLHLALRCVARSQADAPTHQASAGRRVVQMLLAHTADPTRRDQRGRSATKAARDMRCDAELVELLQHPQRERPGRALSATTPSTDGHDDDMTPTDDRDHAVTHRPPREVGSNVRVSLLASDAKGAGQRTDNACMWLTASLAWDAQRAGWTWPPDALAFPPPAG